MDKTLIVGAGKTQEDDSMQLSQQHYVNGGSTILSALILGGAICYAANRLTLPEKRLPPTSNETAEVRLVFPERLNLTIAGVIDGRYELQPKGTFSLAGPRPLNILGDTGYAAIPIKTEDDAQGVGGSVKTLKVELSNSSRGFVTEPFVIRGQ